MCEGVDSHVFPAPANVHESLNVSVSHEQPQRNHAQSTCKCVQRKNANAAVHHFHLKSLVPIKAKRTGRIHAASNVLLCAANVDGL